MKCGIITTHYIPNYGATYQAYGLLTYLNQQEKIDAEIIDYRMNNCVSAEGDKTGSNQTKHSKLFQYLKKIKNVKRRLDHIAKQHKFERFWQKNYIVSKDTFRGDDDLLSRFPSYDFYISGSDQIFNLDLTHFSKGYFFPKENIKKISYSSSFGMNGIPDRHLNTVVDLLSSYNAISIREKNEQSILESKLGKKVCLTSDPVFLLSPTEWMKICKKVKTPSHYILCYIMSNNPNIQPAIEWLKSKSKTKVVIVKTFRERATVDGRIYNNLGPEEFMQVIANADYVVTNSFHGTSFGIIFGKKVLCLEEERFKNDRRYEELFHRCGIEGRIVPANANWESFNFDDCLIDGKASYQTMSEWINDSKDFLRKNLGV